MQIIECRFHFNRICLTVFRLMIKKEDLSNISNVHGWFPWKYIEDEKQVETSLRRTHMHYVKKVIRGQLILSWLNLGAFHCFHPKELSIF